ncbi:hypothetical protein EV586_104221 [Tumebacillus sp. BK434]|uniref:hypothetical protein n=1 Tax=Tumebacillus sp. BK434 TaxID=2512169 RepID=UPI0010EC92BB|nr:hypothetical protein [Tumebacillus sp. BK434]TCP54600.1 hypothetical protein EV586_104221 [Tumebacillus sp. BK434]
MKKFLLRLTALACLLSLATPALAADSKQEDQATGKHHNFEQWQTIKRLHVRDEHR